MDPGIDIAGRPSSESYLASLAAERQIYEHCAQIHNLPPIFHYWSDKYLKPKLDAFGYDDIPELFAATLALKCGPLTEFASLGAGNCDFEIDLAQRLRAAGHFDFQIDCIDLNPSMLERGFQAARQAGVDSHLTFTEADFNSWTAARSYRAVIANQSLHHVINLEGLLAQVRANLSEDGVFLISDMIGRNGHQRWPEAFHITSQLWKQLPASYRVNRAAGYFQQEFEDFDCSREGFEGVRSQDILPLLLKNFSAHFFLPYGNLIDTFVDRSYGCNFDPDSPEDRAFIDMVHDLDVEGLQRGHLTPTHLIGVFGKEEIAAPEMNGFAPHLCIRADDAPPGSWRPVLPETPLPGSAERELVRFTAHMAEARETIRDRINWASGMEAELQRCEEWVALVEGERGNLLRAFELLQDEFHERTDWALRLKSELESSHGALRTLQREFEERTGWALSLRDLCQEQTSQLSDLLSQKQRDARSLEDSREEIAHLKNLLQEQSRGSRFRRVLTRTLKAIGT